MLLLGLYSTLIKFPSIIRVTHNLKIFFFSLYLQATVVCDLVLLYLLPKREFYKNMKFKYTDTQTQVSSVSLL